MQIYWLITELIHLLSYIQIIQYKYLFILLKNQFEKSKQTINKIFD